MPLTLFNKSALTDIFSQGLLSTNRIWFVRVGEFAGLTRNYRFDNEISRVDMSTILQYGKITLDLSVMLFYDNTFVMAIVDSITLNIYTPFV